MSTNYTQNYKLCQWEASDKVLRTDFNDDNVKIDAALAGLQGQVSQNTTTLNTAYTTAKTEVVPGQYTGNGAASQNINLGFRPRAVLVIPGHLYFSTPPTTLDRTFYSGIAVTGTSPVYPCVSLTSNGFTVYYGTAGEVNIQTNTANIKYFYLAIR